MKKKLMAINIILGLCLIPMGVYNSYHILKAVQANQLMWFFFFFCIPIGVVVSVISKIVESMADKK